MSSVDAQRAYYAADRIAKVLPVGLFTAFQYIAAQITVSFCDSLQACYLLSSLLSGGSDQVPLALLAVLNLTGSALADRVCASFLIQVNSYPATKSTLLKSVPCSAEDLLRSVPGRLLCPLRHLGSF